MKCKSLQKEHSILESGLVSCKRYGHVTEDRCKTCEFNAGWRAALEWFRDKLDYSIEHKELKDIIDEELKGGD